jgi:phosphate transport system protein
MTQPRMTRLEFDNGLVLVRESLFSMTGAVTEAILAATTALLDQNLQAAHATASLEQQLDDDRQLIEHSTLQLLARDRQEAGELRMLISAIKISALCWRMGVLAHHIGMAARHCYPAPAIPEELSGIFRQMGDAAARITDDARVSLLDAECLEVEDDTLDGLRRALFRALLDNRSHDIETAVNVALLARYYERLVDHAVALIQSVIFKVTGTKLDVGPQVG